VAIKCAKLVFARMPAHLNLTHEVDETLLLPRHCARIGFAPRRGANLFASKSTGADRALNFSPPHGVRRPRGSTRCGGHRRFIPHPNSRTPRAGCFLDPRGRRDGSASYPSAQ